MAKKDPKGNARDNSQGNKAREKAAKKQVKAAKKLQRKERRQQLKAGFSMTRKADRLLIPILLMAFLVPFVLLLSLGLLIGGFFILSFGVMGVVVGILVVLAVFGRRLQSSQYTQVEGQPGAAAAVIEGLRADWRVTPAVGMTREQDLLHRVIGKPGIILVAEGNPTRMGRMIAAEKKKLARIVGDTPVYDMQVGDGDDQVPLRKLEKTLKKFPKNIKPRDVNILERKLNAMAPTMPIPKGPVPGMGPGGHIKRPKQR